jgi:thiol-disulfide isomerase/thioredoxin
VALTELRGRPVLLDFWSTSCAPCIRDLPNVKRLAEEHKVEVAVWGYRSISPIEIRNGSPSTKRIFPRYQIRNLKFQISTKSKVFPRWF